MKVQTPEEKLFILDLLKLNKSIKIDDKVFYPEESVINIVKQVLNKPVEPAKELTDDHTSKLEKDLKDAEAMFEKMELTAFNFEKRIKKLKELVSAHKNLLNCFGMSKPKNKTNITDLDEAWERIAELEKELGLT